jgi:hypothetical protein
MLCASIEKAGKIAGGFVLLNVAAIMTAWRACRARPLGIGDFRAWLACHELVARRCHVHRDRDRSPRYGVAELAKLTGTPEKRARASIRRLVVAGLLEWSGDAIGFPDQFTGVGKMVREVPAEAGGSTEKLGGKVEQDHVLEDEDVVDCIGRGKGDLAIPRRILRFLVAGARPALIATTLGLLLRCLSRRKGGFDGRGRVKASWIARTFGISIPAVKVARRELIALGWIAAEDSDQWAMNRWGRAFRIDLGWEVPTMSSGPDSIPPHPDPGSNPIPPDLQTPIPSRRNENQEPAGGPSGFSIEDQSTERGPQGPRPPSQPGKGLAPKTPPPGPQSPGGPPPTPRLADVRPEDLKDTGRLLDLHRQAVAKGLVTASEADRLRFIGAAEHALAIATNPTALFAWLVLNGCWRYITGADEDSARRRLRVHDFGMPRMSAQPSPSVFSTSRPIEPGWLSEDARIVKTVREACIRAGVYRDPWPTFVARYPEWTRPRWDAAMAEFGL